MLLHDLPRQRVLAAAGRRQLQQQALAQVAREQARVRHAADAREDRLQLRERGLRLAGRDHRIFVGFLGVRQFAQQFLAWRRQPAVLVQRPDQVLGDVPLARRPVQQRELAQHRLGQRSFQVGRVRHGLELLVDILVGAASFGQRPLALQPLERLQRALAIDAREFGVLVLAAFLDQRTLRQFEEGVFLEFLADARFQLQCRQLQDLHRLDHLRRLQEPLVESRGSNPDMGPSSNAASSALTVISPP